MATKTKTMVKAMEVEQALTDIQTRLNVISETMATKEGVANAKVHLLMWMVGSMGVWSIIIINALSGNG